MVALFHYSHTSSLHHSNKKLKITGTFLDEISHDIPHQNWGVQEWARDFDYMQSIGIDTVILIRCGYKRWMTFDSPYLKKKEGVYAPSTDLVDMFLTLAEERGMSFFFGLYDSGKYWWKQQDFKTETELNLGLIEEVWKKYGHRKAFKGWYLSQEVSRRSKGAIDLYVRLGQHCKDISNGLPIMISPYIDGTKAILSSESSLTKTDATNLKQHESEWNEIFDGIQKVVDIVAFQDGHVDFHELADYLAVNKQLADKYSMQSWSNLESFDRDMPIKFLPIKWEKMWMKLRAAQQAKVDKIITFEFSHFMSPQSAYLQAGHLFNRYKEWSGGIVE